MEVTDDTGAELRVMYRVGLSVRRNVLLGGAPVLLASLDNRKLIFRARIMI